MSSKKSWKKRALAAGLMAAVMGVGMQGFIAPDQAEAKADYSNVFDFQPHRGGRDARPENTLYSYTYAIEHASRLAERGFKVFIIGGQLKLTTEAVIGAAALDSIRSYNFTKGFFGTNGISRVSGFSTPDSSEALVKAEALTRCRKAFVLADSSKFNKISPITFANISCATILTDKLIDKKYRDYTTIIEVDNK